MHSLLHSVQLEGCPGMQRRIHVTEVPLISRNLSTWMEITLFEHDLELILSELDITGVKGYGVKCQVPRRVPRILPLIRHGDDVIVHHVEPILVPRFAYTEPKRLDRSFFLPFVQVEQLTYSGPNLCRERRC